MLRVLALLALPLSASEVLEQWRRQIESQGGRVVVFRAGEPGAEPDDPVLARFLSDPGFLAQFRNTHAMTVNWTPVEGPKTHYVLLNTALRQQWEGAEDAVLAHEFGHAWLDARGFGAPAYTASPMACVSIHAADIVQHILIRSEMNRRGIAYRNYWVRNLEAALEELERQRAGARVSASYCQMLAQVALWIDVRLGLTPEEWDSHGCFLDAMEARWPDLAPLIETMARELEAADLNDLAVYQRVLRTVFLRLAALR